MNQADIDKAVLLAKDLMVIFNAPDADPGYNVAEISEWSGGESTGVRRRLMSSIKCGDLERTQLRSAADGNLFYLYHLPGAFDKGKK